MVLDILRSDTYCGHTEIVELCKDELFPQWTVIVDFPQVDFPQVDFPQVSHVSSESGEKGLVDI